MAIREMGDNGLYALVRAQLEKEYWAILPEKLEQVVEVLDIRAAGMTVPEERIQEVVGMREERISQGLSVNRPQSIAVVSMVGMVANRAGALEQSSGVLSAQRLQSTINSLANDDDISAIILDVDSPGGTVAGTPELADTIYAARAKKPIVASVNGLAASAGYWIAAAATEIVATPSSQLGSIGVFIRHTDVSVQEEKKGIKTTFIHAGKYKVEGNPYEPLSNEARASMQKMANEYYELFTGAVADYRGVDIDTVKNSYGEGRVVRAEEALQLGMIDRIETISEVLDRLSQATGASSAIQARSVALSKREIEIENI